MLGGCCICFSVPQVTSAGFLSTYSVSYRGLPCLKKLENLLREAQGHSVSSGWHGDKQGWVASLARHTAKGSRTGWAKVSGLSVRPNFKQRQEPWTFAEPQTEDQPFTLTFVRWINFYWASERTKISIWVFFFMSPKFPGGEGKNVYSAMWGTLRCKYLQKATDEKGGPPGRPAKASQEKWGLRGLGSTCWALKGGKRQRHSRHFQFLSSCGYLSKAQVLVYAKRCVSLARDIIKIPIN